MRAFWVVAGTVLAVPLLALGVLQSVSALAHETDHTVLSFDDPDIDAVEIHGEGRVTVTGADVEAVTVTMRIDHGLRRTRHTERVVGRTLVLDVDCPGILSNFCQVDHTVEVPRDLDVTIDNDNGAIELHGLGGTLDVDGDNGRITATDLRSPVARVSNDNGRIALELDEAPDRLDVDNDNGSIELVVPDLDEGYAVTTENDNGSVDVAVRNDPDSSRTITVENDNGSITVRSP